MVWNTMCKMHMRLKSMLRMSMLQKAMGRMWVFQAKIKYAGNK